MTQKVTFNFFSLRIPSCLQQVLWLSWSKHLLVNRRSWVWISAMPGIVDCSILLLWRGYISRLSRGMWKIVKAMGIPDHLTCLLRNLYAGQETTVRTQHGTTDGFQTVKGVRQGCILSPCLFNLPADYIKWNARLDEEQAGIKIARRNINNHRYADDTTLIAESEEELKSLLMEVEKESEKAGLKLSIQKMKIMASSPITSLANRRGNNGNSERLYFLRLQNQCRCRLHPLN